MNEDPAEKFANFTKRLKTELNLLDTDEYFQMKRQEVIARRKQLLDSFKKSLEDFALTEEEHEIIELPDDEEADQEPSKKNVPIETLLAAFQESHDKDNSMELERRFYGQSHDIQINLIKAFLNGNEDNRRSCYWLLLVDWWDDAIIPDLEKIWETYRESQCLRVMAHRFPLSHVLAHQEEIAKENYVWLCLRLASEKGFVIDKSKLTRKQYGRILASNHIHLGDDEADSLLFGYIKGDLWRKDKPPRYWINDIRFIFGAYNNVEACLSGFLNYKPSLLALPDMKYLIWVLQHTGNITTLKKFLLWNKNIQQHIPPFLSEDDSQPMTIQRLENRYKAYLDDSWERLKDLAIVTFPVGENNNTDEFRVNPEEDWLNESYDPY